MNDNPVARTIYYDDDYYNYNLYVLFFALNLVSLRQFDSKGIKPAPLG